MLPGVQYWNVYHGERAINHESLMQLKAKLENCVCKTQVMPPCPKPVLTPCPILTHDPQHIQSILETNVWNVKVKIAVILSKS